METKVSPEWQRLRSDIYIRDKGMCWICNTFVPLDEYDLGHIVDRANGGHDDYDNLAVMHRVCNRSKPYHQTLEEALRWKLTSSIPSIQQARGISNRFSAQYYSPLPIKRRKRPKRVRASILAKKQQLYEQNIARIKPGTLCWIQGRPFGGAMWRVLPPPYRKEDIFILRQTPPGAIDDEDGGVYETLQVIGGELTQDINITIPLGHLEYHITSYKGIPSITFTSSKRSNTSIRAKTVGMGMGQIPISAWRKAKFEGITFKDFINQYTGYLVGQG